MRERTAVSLLAQLESVRVARMGEECPPLRGGQSWPQIAMGRATSIDTGWGTPGAPAPQRLVGWPPRPANGRDPPEPPPEEADWRDALMSERGLAADQGVDGLEEMLDELGLGEDDPEAVAALAEAMKGKPKL